MSSSRQTLGSQGPSVYPLALGCAAMSPAHGLATDDAESLATIEEAIERGVDLIDTADFYGTGHNELLIGRAIRGRRDKVVLSCKFGALRSPDGAFAGVDGRPAAVKNFAAYTLTRLGVDHIDIYRLARLDPNVPIEDTVGAIAELVQAGHVGHVGLSEVGPDTIRRAHATYPICDVQIEYSLMSRGPERAVMPLLDELGIAMTAYGVLSHGLLTDTPPQHDGGRRGHLPRFRGENLARNRSLVAALSAIAREKGVSTSRLATAWVLAKGTGVVAVIGARHRAQLRDALGATDITLSSEEVARIERAVPAEAVAGTRYDERLMAMLDSERDGPDR